MADFKVDDKIRVTGEEERFKTLADGTRKPLTNSNGKTGVVVSANPAHTQVFKKNRKDDGRIVRVITVRLDGDDGLRGFPVDVLEKI